MRFSDYIKLTESYVEHEKSRRLGSNPGGTFVHQLTGDHYYIKFPHNPEQAHVEVATAKLYNAMGIRTLNPHIVNIDGRVGVATKWNSALHSLTSPEQYHELMQNPKHADSLAKLHHAAIVTGNRDVIGLDYTNVMQHSGTGELVSADQGGSMHFRAMGGTKPFGHDIDDVKSFQNPEYQTGQVFGKLGQVLSKHTVSLTDDVIDHVINKHGLGSHIGEVIKKRRDLLNSHFSS